MDFMTAVKKVLQENYLNFEGRARRSEFWWFQLFVIVGYIVVGVLFGVLGAVLGDTGATIGSLLYAVFGLGVLLPALAVSVRRLHDIDKSGWWLLIDLVPLVGPILLIVWFCSAGTAGQNKFGSDPVGA